MRAALAEKALIEDLAAKREHRIALLPHWLAAVGISIIMFGLSLAIIGVRVWPK